MHHYISKKNCYKYTGLLLDLQPTFDLISRLNSGECGGTIGYPIPTLVLVANGRRRTFYTALLYSTNSHRITTPIVLVSCSTNWNVSR
uniref:Uncharacterized protein n=1 Tax=Proboscia inermis TaxID=420281 RepID=A0A7S0BY14_9STRA